MDQFYDQNQVSKGQHEHDVRSPGQHYGTARQDAGESNGGFRYNANASGPDYEPVGQGYGPYHGNSVSNKHPVLSGSQGLAGSDQIQQGNVGHTSPLFKRTGGIPENGHSIYSEGYHPGSTENKLDFNQYNVSNDGLGKESYDPRVQHTRQDGQVLNHPDDGSHFHHKCKERQVLREYPLQNAAADNSFITHSPSEGLDGPGFEKHSQQGVGPLVQHAHGLEPYAHNEYERSNANSTAHMHETFGHNFEQLNQTGGQGSLNGSFGHTCHLCGGAQKCPNERFHTHGKSSVDPYAEEIRSDQRLLTSVPASLASSKQVGSLDGHPPVSPSSPGVSPGKKNGLVTKLKEKLHIGHVDSDQRSQDDSALARGMSTEIISNHFRQPIILSSTTGAYNQAIAPNPLLEGADNVATSPRVEEEQFGYGHEALQHNDNIHHSPGHNLRNPPPSPTPYGAQDPETTLSNANAHDRYPTQIDSPAQALHNNKPRNTVHFHLNESDHNSTFDSGNVGAYHQGAAPNDVQSSPKTGGDNIEYNPHHELECNEEIHNASVIQHCPHDLTGRSHQNEHAHHDEEIASPKKKGIVSKIVNKLHSQSDH